MPEFLTPADIGNRALQHCGAQRMDPVLGFTDPTNRGAAEISFCYGKLRQAEMARNEWTFACRKVALRAIDNNTMKLLPAVYSQTATYFVGSVVVDSNGTRWISNTPNNTGNVPSSSTTWDPYYGPLTVSLYDSTALYFAGEVVYTQAGNGLVNAYLSRQSSNPVHPALPNQWLASATYQVNDVVQVFPNWSSLTTYTQGQGVTYTDGNQYASLTNSNLNNIPSTSSANWVLLPVLTLSTVTPTIPNPTIVPPITSPVLEWSQVTTYSLGNVVMFSGTEYLSLANANLGNFPNAVGSSSWIAVTSGTLYMSLINFNIGNAPATNSAALWVSTTTYALNNTVTGSDGQTYTSLANGNVGNNPVTDGGVHWSASGVLTAWTTTFTQGGGNSFWRQIGGASFPSGVGLSLLNMLYPINAGPAGDLTTMNVFFLPSGYLRSATQAENNAGVNWLGGPSGVGFDDFQYEGDFFTSWEVKPIVYRFVADVQDVTKMSTMFCEGLSLRIALEVVEQLTQSEAKLAMIAKKYERFMGEARIINGVNANPATVPDDPFVTVRY